MDVVRLLLEHDADMNEVPEHERLIDSQRAEGLGNALHTAARHGKKEMVRLFLDCGANHGMEDSLGRTALQLAEENRRSEIVDMLNPSR